MYNIVINIRNVIIVFSKAANNAKGPLISKIEGLIMYEISDNNKGSSFGL